MILPPRAAQCGDRSGRRLAGAALLLLATILCGGAARAQDADVFSATVTVDATGDTAAKARDAARLDGQRRALTALVERLPGVGAAAKLPKLDDKAITDLVASFEVAKERMSAVHYVAEYTFHFRPAEVRRVLRSAGIAVAEDSSKPPDPNQPQETSKPPGDAKPLVLLPVYQAGRTVRLWEDPNPWREAWDRRQPTPRLVIPLGDAGDIAAIDADKARDGDAGALTALAQRNGGDDAVVAVAAMRGPPDQPGGIDVMLRRYRAGQLIDTRNTPLAANPGESEAELLTRATGAAAAVIESGWKKEPSPGYDQQGTLTAVLPITGLDDWVRARERLATVPAIRKVALVTLSRQEATIEIGYVGSIDQLKSSLAGVSLDLVRGDPLWRLARTGPDRGQ
jgi:SAM-dependent methyltransferase